MMNIVEFLVVLTYGHHVHILETHQETEIQLWISDDFRPDCVALYQLIIDLMNERMINERTKQLNNLLFN